MTQDLNKNTIDDAFAKIFLGEVRAEQIKQQEVNLEENKPEEQIKVEVENEQKRKTREERTIREEINKTDEEQNEQEKDQQKELLKSDLKVEYESLKKQLSDAKSWGHKKNAAFINAKKKVTEFLSKLQEDSLINEDEATIAIKAFDEAAISEEELKEEDSKGNSYADLKANLDKEFNIFKKYNKDSELDEKYQAFFGFFPLLPADEQEKIVNYIQMENPEVVIDHIITTGSDIYDTVYKGAIKSGGLLPFIKSLHVKIEKLEKRNKQLESDVDTTEGIVHNRSINSKVSNLAPTKQTKNFADIWQN
ncbi:tail-related protein [Megaira polyxenophila phage MAnkyphage_25.80]|nr:tail-related protein [Megaira polyxenophila phage MAnkyphage_25.80]